MKRDILARKWCELPEEPLKALQMAKLRNYLRKMVLPYHAWYREHLSGLEVDDLRTVEDLARIPFTTKEEMANATGGPRSFVIAPEPEGLRRKPSTIAYALLHGKAAAKRALQSEFRPILLTSTTGRSAEPLPFVFTGHDIANLEATGIRIMEVAGAREEDRMLNMFPFAPHLAFWQTHYAGTAFGVFMLSSGGGKTMGTEGNLRLMRKIQPDILVGVPTFIYHVLHEAVQEGVSCEKLRKLVLGGEKVPKGMRRKLIELAKEAGAGEVEVVTTYGFTEAKMAWVECPVSVTENSPGYHLYPDLGIVEIVDPKTGAIQLPGKPGEIVFTALDARGTVVLRYRTGDVTDGGITYEPCPLCGRCCPRLFGKISRRSEIREVQLDKLKGTLVDFNTLEHVLDDMPGLAAWQIELRKANNDPLDVDQVILHVAKEDSVEEESLRDQIARRVFEQTEVHPNSVEFHNMSRMRKLQGVGESLKELKLVDHRPDPSVVTEKGASR
jgi:phenylacetate-CoA ligase